MSTERTASGETYITGPKSAKLYDAIRQGAVDIGLTMDYIYETKTWLTSTVYFKVSGPLSQVTAFKQAEERVADEE